MWRTQCPRIRSHNNAAAQLPFSIGVASSLSVLSPFLLWRFIPFGRPRPLHSFAKMPNGHCHPLSAGSNMLLNLSAVPPPPPPLVSRVHSKEETEAAHDLLSLSQSLPPPPQPQQQQQPLSAISDESSMGPAPLIHKVQPEQPPTPPTPPEDSEHGLKMPQGRSSPTRAHYVQILATVMIRHFDTVEEWQ